MKIISDPKQLKDKHDNPVALTRFVDPTGYWAPDLRMDCYRHTVASTANIASGVKGFTLSIEVQPWRY